MAQAKQFAVPVQDTTPLRVVPGLDLSSAANENVPLRERPPVVNAPGLMITFNRLGIFLTATAMAAIMVWCFRLVFLFLAWVLGFTEINYHFVVLGGFSGVQLALSGFAAGVGILCIVLFVWAFYNWVKFHGPDRRRAPRPISDEIISQHYDLPPNFLWRWQYSRRIIAHHDSRGVVAGAESHDGSWIRNEGKPCEVIKPDTYDILELSARSKVWRRQAAIRKSNVR